MGALQEFHLKRREGFVEHMLHKVIYRGLDQDGTPPWELKLHPLPVGGQVQPTVDKDEAFTELCLEPKWLRV